MKINGRGESALLLLQVIKVLDRCKIPYAIVGAFAASFYGVVRASLDADAVVSLEGGDGKRERLLSLLKKRRLKVTLRHGDLSDPIRGIIRIEDSFQNRVDLLIGIRGMGEDIFERIVSATFMNQKVKVIGIEDFVAMKIYAGSAKDIQDAIGVLRVCADRLSLSLLKQLTRRYGKKELDALQRILSKRGGK